MTNSVPPEANRPDELDVLLREAFHLTTLEKVGYMERFSSPEERARVAEHLSSCELCRQEVQETEKWILNRRKT